VAYLLLGVLESIFNVNGAPKHEIVFVYDGRFVEESVYALPALHGREANGDLLRATWRALDSFGHNHRLVPERLRELLSSTQ